MEFDSQAPVAAPAAQAQEEPARRSYFNAAAAAPAPAQMPATASTPVPASLQPQAETVVDAAPPVPAPAAPAPVAATPAPVAVAAKPASAAAPVAAQAPAAAPATQGMPRVQGFTLPIDALQQVAAASGLQWVNSDAEKIAAVQAAIAAEPQPIHVPRERPPAVVLDESPLVLVETRRNLSAIKLPFEQPPSA